MRDRIELQEQALLMMRRFGEVKKKTIKLYLYTGNKGDIIEKDFTFYKSVDMPDEPKGKRKMLPQSEVLQGY